MTLRSKSKNNPCPQLAETDWTRSQGFIALEAIWTRSQIHCGGISNQARIPETSTQLIFLHTGTPPDNVTVSRGCELIICFDLSA